MAQDPLGRLNPAPAVDRVHGDPGRSGRLVDADHVGVEGQRSERLLLGPADPPDPDAQALRRRLQGRRRVAVEAETKPEHVAVEAGQPLDRVATRS